MVIRLQAKMFTQSIMNKQWRFLGQWGKWVNNLLKQYSNILPSPFSPLKVVHLRNVYARHCFYQQIYNKLICNLWRFIHTFAILSLKINKLLYCPLFYLWKRYLLLKIFWKQEWCQICLLLWQAELPGFMKLLIFRFILYR